MHPGSLAPELCTVALGEPSATLQRSPAAHLPSQPMEHRYRQEPLPVDGAEPRDWSPLVQRTEKPSQCWLPFSDGSQLGPLFNLTPGAE